MGRHNVVSGILVLIVILMIVISTYMVLSYATGVLNAALAFATTDQMTKLQACGITPPTELYKLKADIPSLLLPAIYVGFPGLMIILAILMFVAGYYYGGSIKEEHISSETTTLVNNPHISGRRIEKTQTERSSKSKED